MSADESPSNWLVRGLAAAGRGIAVGGSWVGHQTADLYKMIDPDVQRHLIQVPLLAYSLFDKREVVIEAGQPDGHPPLVFVHGHGGNRGNFLLMGWVFHLAGRKRSYRIHFPGGQSIEQQASALASFVRQVTKVTGEPQVDLVAHSMGGVVSRLAICEHDLGDKVRTLVTLGAPHHGTYPARYGNTATLRDLRPGSDLERWINRRPIPKSVRVVCMWSENDLLVLPPESALLEGAEHKDMTPFTHYSYLIDPKSFAAVREALGDEGGGG